jgi:hypothetical protein
MITSSGKSMLRQLMSILRVKLKMSRPLWGSLSLVLFVVLGFVPLVPEGKAAFSYWQLWAVFLSREWICSAGDFVALLVFHGLIRLIPSVVVGWVLYAIAVVTVAGVRALGAKSVHR